MNDEPAVVYRQTVAFRVDGQPRPKGSRAPVNARRTIESGAKNERKWAKGVRIAALVARSQHKFRMLEGPVRLELTFYRKAPAKPKWKRNGLPDTTPDWDKLGRSVSDALSGILYDDDKRVTTAIVHKRYGEPGALIKVTEIVERAKPPTKEAR